MGKNLLSTISQLLAFSLVGLICFMWMLGYMENSNMDINGAPTARAGVGLDMESEPAAPTTAWRGRDERNSTFEMPRQVTGRRSGSYNSAGEEAENQGNRRKEQSSLSRAEVVRTWKGVHRDLSYAADCYRRFGRDVQSLSQEYGLYPEVFMARLIAYSYEYIEYAGQDPTDFNFPALKKGSSAGRAQFGSTRESLRAYATLNAGEINSLSMEAALAKHDRAWTMRKIIESNRFMAELQENSSGKENVYKGSAGPAGRFSESESRDLEYSGETLKMVSSVEKRIKQRQAKEAGFDDWDEYMGSLPEEMKEKQEEHTKAVISTVSKKKAFNLQRRVDAKTRQ